MKFSLLIKTAFFLFLFSAPVFADENIVNLYNWSNYLPNDVIAQFEKETGVHINYTSYDSNETLYAKLKADPHAGYDIVVPSTYFIDRMRKQGMLEKLDRTKLTNFNNLNPDLLNKSYDPHNDYSIPYLWGTTAIVVNDKYLDPNSVLHWSDLFAPKFKDQLMLLDDTREVFAVGLIVLGYSPNDTNPAHIKQAYLRLKTLLPNVKLFRSDGIQDIYIDEDAWIGMGWSGDIFQANQENSHIHYIFPQEGFTMWLDSLAIPQGAPHLANAYKLINFLLRPDVAKKISMEIGYASPNLTAIKQMPPAIQHNPIIYPDSKIIKNGQWQLDVGNADAIYERYMELLKIGA